MRVARHEIRSFVVIASKEKSFALAALGQTLMLQGRYRDAERILRDAMEVAARVVASAVQGHALCSLGPALVERAQVDEALAAMDSAAVLCREYGTTEDVCRVHIYYRAGCYADAAEQAGEACVMRIDAGHRHYGETILDNGILALPHRGSGSRRSRHSRRSEPVFRGRTHRPLLAQGRLAEACTVIACVLESAAHSDDTQHRAISALQAGELATAERQLDEARAFFDEGLARGEDAFLMPRGYARVLHCEAERQDAAAPDAPGPTRPARSEIKRMWVDEAHRGAGTGRAMVDHPDRGRADRRVRTDPGSTARTS